MPFNVSWHTLLDELDDLPDGAILLTPLSHNRFRITSVQEHRVILKDQLAASEGDEAEELRREIAELEDRIEELTEFKSGQSFHTPAGGES